MLGQFQTLKRHWQTWQWKFYSSIDVKEAFHGVELTKESLPKSAIITLWRLYEYLRSKFWIKRLNECLLQNEFICPKQHENNEVMNHVDNSIVLG